MTCFPPASARLLALATGVLLLPGLAYGQQDYWVFVGTYTRGESEGIYTCRLEGDSGALTHVAVTGGIPNPSFLAVHPQQEYLYAASEVARFQDQATGAVVALAVDAATGQLTKLNEQPSGGAGPCHLVVDASGRCVLVANYGGGSVASLPIQADGTLEAASAIRRHEGSSVNPRRQQAPHAHSIILSPDNRFAYAADLGIDQVLAYRFHPDMGLLEPHLPGSARLTPGSGPRHMAFAPDGRWIYVINELASTLTVFAYQAAVGRLTEVQTISTLPTDFQGTNSTAEVRVAPDGRFVYGSNRGHDSIAVFAVDEETGRLSPRGHTSTGGRTPRNFNLDPEGRFLLAANQSSNSIVVFGVEPDGTLTDTGQEIALPTPVCLRMIPVPGAE